ncbi:hypothetical protein A9Q98_08445 [Thalassotalea sp. 42_200_T64]|nr:hypothetical protein A9Q98_08445 [Thalassotalea sp. 42_200_T64]
MNIYRLFCLVIFFLGGVVACTESQSAQAMQGKQWPQLAMSALYPTVEADKENKPWQLINVWATWCEPCRKEMPMLENLASALTAENFSLILLSIDTDLNLVKEFTLRYYIDSSVFITSRDEVEQQLSVLSYPMTFLVNPEGEIVKVYQGVREWDSSLMIASIKNIINEPVNTNSQ